MSEFIDHSQLNRDPFEPKFLRSSTHTYIEELETKYLLALQEGTPAEALKEELLEQYSFRRMEEERYDYLEALSQGDSERCKEIVLQLAARFEKSGSFAWAAQEYFELGDFQKAAELYIKTARESWSSKSFAFAAQCLVLAKGEGREQEVYQEMAEEIKRYINEQISERGEVSDREWTYHILGECLHRAGDQKQALKAFKKVAGRDRYDRMKAEIDYLARIEDWEKAAKAQKRLIEEGELYSTHNYQILAELYGRADLKSKQVDALCKAKEYFEAAKIAYGITKNKEYFVEAGRRYDQTRSESLPRFFREVWESVHNRLFYVSSKEADKTSEQKMSEILQMVYLAYDIPFSSIDLTSFSQDPQERLEMAKKLHNEFLKRQENAKKKDLIQLLSEPLFPQVLIYAAPLGVSSQKMEEIFKQGFVGLPRKRPIADSLSAELRKIWEESLKRERIFVCYDPVEMAARAYEEGGFYKEAKARYLKANLFAEAKRMDELMVQQKAS